MKRTIKKQAVILLALWAVQIAFAVLSENYEPLMRFLGARNQYEYDGSFALLVIALMSVVALVLNVAIDAVADSLTWKGFWISIPASIALATTAYWIMVVPAWVVLFELGLVGK